MLFTYCYHEVTLCTNPTTLCRHQYGAEITKTIIPTYMGQVDKEGNVPLKTAIIRQLVKMALREHGDVAMEIIRVMEKVSKTL